MPVQPLDLLSACEEGNEESVSSLLAAGADPNPQNEVRNAEIANSSYGMTDSSQLASCIDNIIHCMHAQYQKKCKLPMLNSTCGSS